MLNASEAMRLGSMIRPQTFGDYYSGGASCAMAAAIEACGVDITNPKIDFEEESLKLFPYLFPENNSSMCPVDECCNEKCDHHEMVIHLNDTHNWTRERIADWVATLEAQLEICPPDQRVTEPAHA